MKNLSFFSGISVPCLAPASTISFNSIFALPYSAEMRYESTKPAILCGGKVGAAPSEDMATIGRRIMIRCDGSTRAMRC